jgi:hypothetical protein
MKLAFALLDELRADLRSQQRGRHADHGEHGEADEAPIQGPIGHGDSPGGRVAAVSYH